VVNTIPSDPAVERVPESALNGIAQAISPASLTSVQERSHALKRRQWAIVLVGIAVLLFAGCSSPPPPIAEFSTTSGSGNAPLDISFILDESVDGESFNWDFGDGTGSSEPEPGHTFQDAGTFTVRLTVTKGEQSSVAERQILVEPGEAGWVLIEGGAASISSLGTALYSATAFDVLGNQVSDPVLSWKVYSGAGTIDGEGLFTVGNGLGNFPDAISVEFERLGTTVSQQTGIVIVAGPLHTFSIEPSELDIGVGRTLAISVNAVDEAGHALDSAVVRFTALRRGDSIDPTGFFTASDTVADEGSELVSVEVELDGQIIEATIMGVVRPGILDQVHVSSLPESMAVGESVQVDAYATDRFGNKLDPVELRWTVTDPGIGSVTESGLFTAGTMAGTYVEEGLTIRGIADRVESVVTAPITITAGPATSISIVPDGDSVPIGAGAPFEVVVRDPHGNVLEVEPDIYEYEYSVAGRGNESAVFVAGYELGDFENAITVRLRSGAAGNTEELVAQSDITVRQRSSNIVAVETADQDGGLIMLIDLETAQFEVASPAFSNNGAVELSPSWWPDGSRLVYVSDLPGSLQAYTLDLETRETVRLTDVDGGVSMAVVSPDGRSIAFVFLEGDSWQLYVAPIPDDVSTNPITLDDGTRISVDDSSKHILPYWSPDGSLLLASINRPGGSISMALFDPFPPGDTLTDPEIIGPPGTIAFGWNPDGTGVYFGLSSPDGTLDLGTLDRATGVPEFIELSLDFLIAAWAPDGSELMAIDSLIGAAWFVDSDGTGLRRAVDSEQSPTRVSWRPREYGDPVARSISDPTSDNAQTMLEAGDEPAPPAGALNTGLSYSAVITTELGDINIDLFDDLAPLTVENFINLSRIGFYDGLQFHRVIPGFVSQAGSALTNGVEGPGYMFNDEFSRQLSHDSAGVVSMANAGANTNGSQFFITHAAATELDAYDASTNLKKNCADDEISCHSIFGVVTSGIEIVTGMAERDPATSDTGGVKILSIVITEN
jgi:cyclophilin family peptidyl-prolyl cis-trans isomerase/PKD repeat protein